MKHRQRVLMIAPAFAPNFFSEALVNSKLALAMLNAGWDVTVFSAAASQSYVYTAAWDDPWQPLSEIVHQVAPQAASQNLGKIAKLVQALALGHHPLPGAMWAAKTAEAALNLHQNEPFDLMLTRSTSCIAHLPGLIVKRRTGLPWIANWNDPPGHLFPPPYTYPISRSQRFFTERYLREVANKADVNTFPSERLMTYLTGPLHLIDAGRMAVVPHIGLGWKGRPPREGKDTFRICHSGNLSIERDPLDFLRAFAEVITCYPNIKFELSLIGKMPERILPEVQKLGLSDIVTYTLDLSFRECLQHLEDADALLLIEAPVEEGIFFPSKIVDYCEVGRPILTISPKKGVMRDLNEQHQLGYFAEVGDKKSISETLNRLVSDWLENRISYTGLNELRRQTSPSAVVEHIARLAWPQKK